MRIPIKALAGILDYDFPVWINAGRHCYRYDDIREAAEEFPEDIIELITLDAAGELTIEIESEEVK